MEEWKEIKGVANYIISNRGLIIDSSTNGIITGFIGPNGYKNISLPGKKRKLTTFHRLVAEAFIPKPDGKTQVNHLDGNKLNNCVENLQWVTQSENIIHSYGMGLRKYKPLHYLGKFGAEHNRSKEVKCSNGETYGSLSEAARKLGGSVSAIGLAIKEGRPMRNGLSFFYTETG